MESARDARPPVWVGHVFLSTDRLAESRAFMLAVGMRPIADGADFAVFELRGGTHLLLLRRDEVQPAQAPFDLMVEDLDAAHRRFAELCLAPSPIERGSVHDSFTLREPAGHEIRVNSSHVSEHPV
jgi:hypothetical protein